LLSGLGDSDDDARAPAAMAAYERGAHHLGIARAVEAVIRAAVRDLDHLFDDRLPVLSGRIDEVGHAELSAPLFLAGVDVDADDAVRTHQLRPPDHVEADPAESEHHDV